MRYPASDHYDGTHFFNPEPRDRTSGGGSRGILSFLWRRYVRGQMPEGWAAWPKAVANQTYPLPEAGAGIAATFIGHASFLLRVGGLAVLTDPVFSDRASPVQWAGPKRVRPPGLALEALPKIDLLLLSHNHYDHLDLKALRALRRRFPAMAIVTGLGNRRFLQARGVAGAVELDWWQTAALPGGVRVTAVPARHFSARTLWDRNKTLWCGLYLEAAGRKIYFAGDSGASRAFTEIGRRLGPPDLALLPIGAYAPRAMMGTVHMNPAEAVRAVQDLGGARALGMHFGTFRLTAEAIDAPPAELRRALAEAGVPAERFTTLDVGETAIFPPAG